MVFLIMGPQGSGKTTQAEMLAEKINLPFIPMGEILRTLYERKVPIGIEAHKYWEKGMLVPDDLMRQVVEEYFRNHNLSHGFVMDGFPRDMAQYLWMEEVFQQKITAVVMIMIEHEEIMHRLNKRRRLENREDETPAAIKLRLKYFEEDTLPLIKEMRNDGHPVHEVDGNQSIESIQGEIQEIAQKYLDE